MKKINITLKVVISVSKSEAVFQTASEIARLPVLHIKDLVYVPPLPRTLVELRERIDAAVMTIYRMMLQNVWNELDYRLDVCRVTQGAYIEHW
jgi:hypothetical protein